MNHNILVFLIFIYSVFLVEVDALVCGNNQIENCKECGKGNKSDTCAICEDNYFPLLENIFCFSCDDPVYGQAGCKGACSYKIDNTNELYVNCKDCKEGYFNKEGVCFKCDSTL